MNADEFSRPLVLGERAFATGVRGTVQLPVGHLITHEIVGLTVHVHRGHRPGPRLLVTAAVHGDEINGIEVVRRLLRRKMRGLAGDLIFIPVVNLPAFLARSRYLPDRRDLNRLFPGSAKGSFGARLAHVLTREVASQCTHCVDLHTGAIKRPNLPQTRFSVETPGAMELASVFGAPMMIASDLRQGSFRETFASQDKPHLIFEGGEADILEPASVTIALKGILSVMRQIGMLRPLKNPRTRPTPILCRNTYWERAPRGGLFLPGLKLGTVIKKGGFLGEIGEPFSSEKTPIYAARDGVLIGCTRNAVIDEGDGIFHIGLTENPNEITKNLEAAVDELEHPFDHPVFDETLDD